MTTLWEDTKDFLGMLATVGVGLLLIVLGLSFATATITTAVCRKPLAVISELGYNAPEVQIFCRRIDASLEDFLYSPGLRKQYEAFVNGETTDFIYSAENNKQKKDARNSGYANGVAAGLAVGLSVSK